MFKKIALIAIVALSGCAEGDNIFTDVGTLSASGAAPISPEQRKLRKQERKYAATRVNATALGAGFGALGCILLDCSTEQTLAAAAIGAGAGYVGGSYLTRDNQSFQTSQASLQADIDAARNENAILQENVNAAQATLRFHRTEIARLNRALGAGELNISAYRVSYNRMQGDLQSTRRMIERARADTTRLSNDVNRYRAAGFGTEPLSQELSQQRERLRRLQAVERSMVEVLNGVPSSVRGVS
ncbi:MAG: hypothetical protein GDA36_09975 [Rhodobacteraceae bacterium]|nr:hypothetical protein [Paracoccaceae bacterium]